MNRLIVAMSSNGIIGLDGKIPWRYKGDFKRFKKVTMGGVLIMGRKTWESIGRPLPGRKNFIVSKTMTQEPEGTWVFDTLSDALEECENMDNWMIGGAGIYEEGMQYAQEIDITYVPDQIIDPEDPARRCVRFPPIDALTFVPGALLKHEYEPKLTRCIYKRINPVG